MVVFYTGERESKKIEIYVEIMNGYVDKKLMRKRLKIEPYACNTLHSFNLFTKRASSHYMVHI